MQKTTLHEEGRNLRVLADYDVIVIGAGIAGCAAAVAASRVKGTRVCIVENFCLPGGLATIGNVIVYLPLCDGRGHQVCGGLAEAQSRMSVACEKEAKRNVGILPVPACWNKGGDLEERKKVRFRTEFNPMYFALELEKQLRARHVKLIYAARFAGVIKEGKVIKAVVLETKSGRVALTCRAVVDASGDADVCVAAGEKVATSAKNVRCGWYYTNENDGMHLYRETDTIYYKPGSGKPPRYFNFDALNGIPSQIIASHDMMKDRMRQTHEVKGEMPFIANIPTYPTFRMTRHLVGRVVMKASDDHRWFSDAVGMTGDWRKAGPIFCIPFRALAAVNTSNLIAAGRCISTTGDNWDVMRVIPPCAVTGEAAGAAAAMLAQDNSALSFADLSIPALQKHLISHKAIIDRSILDK